MPFSFLRKEAFLLLLRQAKGKESQKAYLINELWHCLHLIHLPMAITALQNSTMAVHYKDYKKVFFLEILL